MQLHLVTRQGLHGRSAGANGEQLLLEGEWPETQGEKHSLNQRATARFAWIDGRVDRLHARSLRALERDAPRPELLPQSLLALELRYYLVKLARFVAVVDELLQSGKFHEVMLWCSQGRDEDYVDLAGQLCRKWRTPLKARAAIDSNQGTEKALPQAPMQRFRTGLGRAARAPRSLLRAAATCVQRIDGSLSSTPCAGFAIVLCGVPAQLGPLVEPLQSQTAASVYWLCETVAQRQYLKWRPRGVRFLCCNEPRHRTEADGDTRALMPEENRRDRLLLCGADLGPALRRWLDRQWCRHGARLVRCRLRIAEHFRRLRPRWLLLDEDATPLKRVAVAVARQHGIPSAVVQHGAPYISFGFAPLAADALFAWGESSRRQFQRWGIPRDRLRVTGPPKYDARCAGLHANAAAPPQRKNPSRQLVLFASVHHNDDRPDVVSLQFTAATNAEMVRMALRALRRFPACKLVIKLHPRTRDPQFFSDLLAEFPELTKRVRMLRRCRNERLVRQSACVLSCASSAGIEAMLCGVPVIQLMPAGSADLLRPEDWPFAATARTQEELESCLDAVLDGRVRAPLRDELGNVFANLQHPAAPRIALALCAMEISRPAVLGVPAWSAGAPAVPAGKVLA